MSFRRFFRKRRFCLKYIFLVSITIVLVSLWRSAVDISLSGTGSINPKYPFVVEFGKSANSLKNGNNNINGHMCFAQGKFELSNHADIYTYDLPEVTNYSLITGKRFKEYNIPVKTEEVAHGPNLDPVTVLLIPFSHVDPGYGRTIEEYYSVQTKHTLDNMVKKLGQYEDLTFQWAETVFLERWWRDIKPEVKEQVRALIQKGQLEIVLGGWVMPDEASTHYISVIDQLVEGHQWVVENLETKPKNSWSNDPFGFSSTMPYLWKKTGMENMIILRIHQAIKGTLMKKKAMEFTWKQLWSDREENNILCHLMAYRGYWIGDTCGPYNQHICREYAFMHTEPIHKVIFITKENLAERARILYEQYRITSEIYRRHGLDGTEPGVRLFLPMFLGEDFSYTSARDFDLTYTNYKMLFDYINDKKEWKMNVKFGTIQEYFELVRDYQQTRSSVDGSRFPSVAGDFFPYSDYQNDYWTGYYTTRPFNKQISRELQYLIRMADVFHSYAYAYSEHESLQYNNFQQISRDLRSARRELGMFLHHDGITGTSVLHVIQDFQSRLFSAVTKTKGAIKDIATQLLTSGKRNSTGGFHDLSQRAGRQSVNQFVSLPNKSKGKIVIMNPSSKQRSEIVNFMTSEPVKLFKSMSKETVNIQLDKAGNDYVVSFLVDVLPFSIDTYVFETVPKEQIDDKTIGDKSGHNDETNIVIKNSYLRAEFDKRTGMLVNLTELGAEEKTIEVQMEILAYTSLRSGAYIFAPAGSAKQYLYQKPSIEVTRGTLKSSVSVTYKGFSFIATLHNTKGIQGQGLHITNLLDMKSIDCNNKEAIMRLKTNIKSESRFFTDQNGFQLMGRKTYKDRAIEQNFYPITTAMMIEDSSRRLTLHAAQSHGGASLESGWMEVMLDRCVSRDDDKGLGQGVSDNVPTVSRFVLQFESFAQKITQKEIRYTYPSTSAILMTDIIDHPLYLLYLVHPNTIQEESLWKNDFKPLKHSLPCALDVVSIRSLVKNDLTYNSTSVILHKKAPMCLGRDTDKLYCDQGQGRVTIATLFPEITIGSVTETSLSHLHVLSKVSTSDEITPRDMELRSFTIDF